VLRSKEMAYDYRYFPDPDLQPVRLQQRWIDELRKNLPALPAERKLRYTSQLGLSVYDTSIITQERAVADYFEAVITHTLNYKAAANWIIGPVQSWLNETNSTIGSFPLPPQRIASLIEWIDKGKISQSAATQQLFPAWVSEPETMINELVQRLNLLIDTCDDELSIRIDQVLAKYPDKVKEYHSGKKGVAGMFMGELMKMTAGKIDPAKANQLLTQKLIALK
jgi:aspartyl-tRNA(Asn)/glutamyl-tRNA(Gln) amidotransferase subunit B